MDGAEDPWRVGSVHHHCLHVQRNAFSRAILRTGKGKIHTVHGDHEYITMLVMF